MKKILKSLLGTRQYIALREAWLHYRFFRRQMECLEPDVKARYFDPRWSAGLERGRSLKDAHAGQRCFILGNGPSLSRMDLSLLRNEVTFGLNRIYLLFDRMGFETTYHVVINQLVIDQCADELDALTMPRFVNWRARGRVPDRDNVIYLLDPLDYSLGFSRAPMGRIWEGSTVTYVAMQLAYFMGFETVILIGVDHNFAAQGKPDEMVVSSGDDQDHFDPGYFGKGFRWQLPDLETSALSYRLAKLHFESQGRRILDATMGGKLDVFPKVDYASLF
jgi:hypothetical protein